MPSAKGVRLFSKDAHQHDIREDYDFGKTLGTGAFSTVKEAKQKRTGKIVAIKIIDKSNLEVSPESLKTEVTILKSVKDPNIVELYDIYENDEKLYLVMELLTGGELFDRIVNVHPNGYSEKTASKIIKKLVQSIQYLHKKGIVHRDLKPENLIYANASDDSEVKITDFGLAKIAVGNSYLTTACGTPNYVAPEVLMNEGYDEAVDMWSIGVILYILLCGFPPFYSDSTPELFDQIMAGKYNFPSPYWDHISREAKDLITHLLQTDVDKRFTPDQVLQHPWIKLQATPDVHIPAVISQMKKYNESRKKFNATLEVVLAAQKFLKLRKK